MDCIQRTLRSLLLSETIGKELMDLHVKGLDSSQESLKKLSIKKSENSEMKIGSEANADLWSLIKRIAACALAAFSALVGFSLLATGGAAPAGALLVSSSLLTLANLTLMETGGWDWVVNKLAQDNEDLKKKLSFILPLSVGALAAATSVYFSFQGLGAAVGSVDKILQLATSSATLAEGVASYKEASAIYETHQAEAKRSELESALLTHRDTAEGLQKAILSLSEEESKSAEKIEQMLQIQHGCIQTILG